MKTTNSSSTPNLREDSPGLSSFTTPLRRRITAPVGAAPSRTKQEFKDDCDVNRILAKFQRTGALTHFAKYAPFYDDINACDYQTAQNLLLRARNMFDALPSNIRAHVSTPAGFLEFVQDPKNKAKMQEFGLIPTPPPITPAPPAGASAGNPAPAAAS
ncbi:MAG: internal scaffolding protein [Microviridae sp.]|nr:MAG: internal scaffolding protein [Microviridae sp.]